MADTTYLVGLWRRKPAILEHARGHEAESVTIPWVVCGEFWHGARVARHEPAVVRQFLERFLMFDDAGACVEKYAEICASLQRSRVYREIGQNDLWIAASALVCDLTLTTANVRHFDKVPGLKLVVVE